MMRDSSVGSISRAPRRAGVFLAAAALVSCWSSFAAAEQFVVVDETYEHTPDMPDSHYRVEPRPGTPSNWKSPIDYTTGTAHMHLEVYTKPTDTPTRFQACFEAQPTYACVGQAPAYTTVGVYDWATKFSDFWSPPGTAVDWTLGSGKIALILKDTQNGKPSADNVGAETAALYMPTKVRFVVTIVSEGSTYVPPAPVEMDAGVPDDAGAGSSTGAGGSGGSGGNGSGGNGGAGGDPVNVHPVNDSGCSFSMGNGAAQGAWLLLAAPALLAMRTRRKRSR
ncbi:hypothetical protein QHF83_01240 [Polyangium sp. 15x6]|nr:hypothetical protein [Polyangium sp. 15x6]